MTGSIKATGIKELRRDLKAVDKALPKEVTKALKGAAGVVASEARILAPKRTGRLARSLKPVGRGNRALVRSTLPYAPVISYGYPKRGIRPNPFLETAADRKSDEALQVLARELDGLLSRHGFK